MQAIRKYTSKMLICILLISMLLPVLNVTALSDEQKQTANQIGGYLIQELGLNVNVVFGILANIEVESEFDPAKIEYGYTNTSGGCGICQWTNDPRTLGSGRRTNMKKMCDPGCTDSSTAWKTDLKGQLKYLKKELTGGYKDSVLNKLKDLPDNEEGRHKAAEIWCTEFESPDDEDEEAKDRVKLSDKLYKEMGGKIDGYSAGGIVDYAVKQELFAPVTDIKLTDGSILATTNDEKTERLEWNSEILKTTSVDGTSTGAVHSLYERFGPKLQFMEYLGETTYNIELVDHIVSAATEDKIDEISITDDIVRYDSHIYLSTVVYKNRPPALDEDMLKNGYMDSRVVAYKNLMKIGKLYTLVHAKWILGFSSFLVGIINLFIDNHFFVFILNTFKTIVESDAWKMVDVGVNFILGIFILFYIVSLIKHAIGYARGKSGETLGVFITRWLVGIFAIGLVAVFIAQPSAMLDRAGKIINFSDRLINENIAEVKKDDPVIYSETGEYTMQAMVWETALFDPWCKAIFGREYDKCYTQYADVSNDKKLPQSYEPDHEHPDPANSDDSEIFYDSAGCTGDVFVDLGGGKLERNWAAYALSTMSIYHIGYEVYEDEKDTSQFTHFPNALTSYRNKNLYADTFRWIDAKMNISPQYFVDDAEGASFNSYGESVDFTTHYYKHSWEMLWKALLLAGLLPVIILRLKAFLGLLYVTIKGIYYSLVELAKENQGLNRFWDDLQENFFEYIYRSIQLYILLFIYTSLVSQTFFLQCVYIVLCILISTTSLQDLGRRVKHLGKDIKHLVTN